VLSMLSKLIILITKCEGEEKQSILQENMLRFLSTNNFRGIIKNSDTLIVHFVLQKVIFNITKLFDLKRIDIFCPRLIY